MQRIKQIYTNLISRDQSESASSAFHSVFKLLILTSSFLILSTLSSFAQQPEYPDSGFTNKAEAKNLTINGKKEGKWVEYYNTRDTNESPWYSLAAYKKGKILGIVRYYFYNGKLSGEAPYTDGDLNGVEKVYYPDGKVLKEIPYTKGITNGVGKAYYDDGKIEGEFPFVNGKENGVEKAYYPSGANSRERPYLNDKRNGIEKCYYENGSLKSETIWVNDAEGATTKYDENGNEIK